jgi:hypothetical protein
MAFLDWIKSPEHVYKADPGIKTIWNGGPYSDKGSGYSVQACLGMSDKGYHSGLTFTPPNGEAKTTWGRPVQRRDHAMKESYSAFTGWVESHEAHSDAKQQPERAVDKMPRRSPSWER